MYSYHEGCYYPDGEEVVQKQLVDERENDYSSGMLTNAIQIVQGLTFCDFDNPPAELICVQNGLLNIKTGELSEHTPNCFFQSKMPVAYDKDAKCPSFLEWVNQVLPEPKKRDCLQEIFGYCLLRGMPLHKLLFLVGSGRNGKGTFTRTLTNIIGDNNCAAIPLELMGSRFQVTNLFGKLINISSEPRVKDYLNTEVIKKVTGEDLITGEIKGKQKLLSFTNYAKFIVMANKLPKVEDDTVAWWERVVVLEFTEEFTKQNGKLQPNIEKKWLENESERSGILNWAIEGLKRLLQNNDFTKSEEMVNVEKEYRRYSDPVACFISDCCELGRELLISKIGLYEAYEKYSDENDFETLSNTKFNEHLKQLPRLKADVQRFDEKLVKVWRGITLKPEYVTDITDVTTIHTHHNKLDNPKYIGVGIKGGNIGKTSNKLDLLISLVAHSPDGVTLDRFIALCKENYPNDDPAKMLQWLVEQGILYEPSKDLFRKV